MWVGKSKGENTCKCIEKGIDFGSLGIGIVGVGNKTYKIKYTGTQVSLIIRRE